MSRRSINPQEKIDTVIRTARRLFVEKGFNGVAIPEIVKESGVSVGAIYLHFGNKEKLAEAIYRWTLDQFTLMLDECLEGKSGTREKLEAFSKLVFEIAEKDPEMMKFMLAARRDTRSVLIFPLCSSDAFMKVQKIVHSGLESGEIRSSDYLIAAVSYTGVIVRAIELRLQGVLDQPLQVYQADLLEHAWRSVQA